MKKLFLILTIISLYSCEQSDQKTVGSPLLESNKIKKNHKIEKQIPKGQLTKDIVPNHINLELTIVPDDEYFMGKTTIFSTINKAQNSYYIHGNLLSVGSVEIKTATGELIEGEYKQIDDSGIAQITFPKIIEAGDIELTIDYRAKFNESLEGLYRVKDGEINYAFTQFESISARLAFPGFDEPAFKVPFDVSLIVKEDHVAIANTPVEKITQLPNGMKKIKYMTSKPLPAYLVAFAVGEFDVVKWEDLPITQVRNRTVPLSGFATKGKGGKLKYALQHTQEILEGLENYFQIPYPYLKLDIIAVPDFSAGAMENAGLITYREQLLLLDENSSQGQKRRYMMVHAHELAHQWFGNLVTPYWWNDIWLNEAFATWMSYTALHAVYPDQNFDQSIIIRSLAAMGSDSLISARQIRQPILSNHDISSAFDGITYSKGGGVLEMMNIFLTPQQFRIGIQNYMRTYSFKNANADEFIAAISQASKNIHADIIKSSFNSFLEQAGIPYLNIISRCEDGINHLNIEQTRFLPLGSQGASDNQTWEIPVCMSYEIDGKPHQDCHMLDNKNQDFTLAGTGCASFIMPNTNGSGYFRYSLSKEDWSNLYNNIKNLSTNEIISLNDSFSAAVEKGSIDFSSLMKFAPIIIDSQLSNIASSPMYTISYMKEKVASSEQDSKRLATIANQLYISHYKNLGFKSRKTDDVEQIKLRNSVINFLADTGNNKEIRNKLTSMAKLYTGYEKDQQLHEELMDSNLINLALRVAVEDLDNDFSEHLVNLFGKATDGSVRGRLLNAIATSTDEDFANNTRDWVLSERLRDNEIYTIIFTHISDNDNREGMWLWVKNNFEAFKQRVPIWGRGRLPTIGSEFCSIEKKQELLDFFEPIIDTLSGGPRYLAQTTEGIDLCIAKLSNDKKMLSDYLETLD